MATGRHQRTRRAGAAGSGLLLALSMLIVITATPSGAPAFADTAPALLPGAPSTIVLAASSTTFEAGGTDTLTATTDVDVSLSSSTISIEDQTTTHTVATCTSGTTCSASVSFATGGPHTYVASVDDLTSQAVTISREAWTVTLSADQTQISTGQLATLTLSANQQVSQNGYTLYLYDKTTGALVQCSATQSSYTQPVSFTTGSPHDYVAVVAASGCSPSTGLDQLSDVQATSNVVTVSRQPWTVTLTTDQTQISAGQSARLTLTANQQVSQNGYTLYLYDKTTGALVQCSATQSSYTQPVSLTTGSPHDYVAVVAASGCNASTSLDQLSDVQATSNMVTITQQPWAVTLSADETVFDAGTSAHLTVTANQNIVADGYVLYLYDETAQKIIQCSAYNSTYTQPISFATGGPHDFVGVIAGQSGCAPDTPLDQLPDVQAISNVVTLSRATWSVTLTTDETQFAAGSSAQLSATANQAPSQGGYTLYVYDITTGALVQCSWNNSSYTTPASFSNGGPQSYVAVVAASGCNSATTYDELQDVQAVSNQVTLSREPWTVSLAAGWMAYQPGETAQLTATANQAVERTNGQWVLSVWDYTTGRLVNYCGYSPCTVTASVTADNLGDLYVAFVGAVAFDGYDGGGNPIYTLSDVQASSNGFSAGTGSGAVLAGESTGGSNPSESSCQNCVGDPIDTATGAFTESNTDLGLPGKGPGELVVRSYDSSAAAADSPLGHGWSFNYGAHLIFGAVLGDDPLPRSVTVVQENGSTVTFVDDPQHNYVAPTRVLASLSYNSSAQTWTFLRKATEAMSFNSVGILTSLNDLLGNTVSLSYSGGLLSTAAASGGRSLSFTWSGGHITQITDSASRTMTYGYDGAGELSTCTAVDGAVTRYGYDASHRLTTVTRPGGGVTTNHYDSSGRVDAQTDPDQRTTSFAYTGSPASSGTTTTTAPDGSVSVDSYTNNELVSQTKASGTPVAGSWTYAYDTAGNEMSVTDPNGATISYTYDANGNRTSTTDPLGDTTTTTYDTLNDPTSVTDPDGHATTMTWDPHGLLSTRTSPGGHEQHYTYNDDGTLATAADATDALTRDTYTPAGLVRTITNPDERTTTYGYDAAGRATSITDNAGHITATAYDAAGRITSVTDPDGDVTSYGYDLDGHRTSVTDPNGHTTNFSYDSAGQLTARTDATGRTTSYTYTPRGLLASITDPDSHVINYGYDARGNKTSSTDPDGQITRYLFDGDSRLLSTTTPTGAVSSTSYNAAGRPTSITDANGNVSSYSYDANGNTTSSTDPDGRTTSYAYTAGGQLSQVTNPDGSSLSYGYDAAGRQTSFTDADGHVQSTQYDPAGLITKQIQPGALTTTISYDTAGNQSVVTRPDGSTATDAYDDAGRLTGITFSTPGTHAISYTYDPAGNLTSTADATGVTTNSHDADNRVTSVANGAGATVGYAYDPAGQLSALTYPGGNAVSYSYDSVGQLHTATDWTGRTTTFGYDNDGNLTTQADPNGATATTAYTPAGQPTDITINKASSTLADYRYTWGKSGQLASDTSTVTDDPAATLSHTYSYDPVSQLSNTATTTGSGDGTTTSNTGYSATPAGLLTGPGNGATQAFNPAEQVTATTPVGGPATSYQYDGNGARTAQTVAMFGRVPAQTTSYTYSATGSLASATVPSGDTVAYTSSVDGLRQSRTDSGLTAQFTWDTAAPTPLLLDDGAHRYLYGPDTTPYAQIDDHTGAIDYLHSDLLGSTRLITDDAGVVVASNTYDSYGAPTHHTGAATSAIGYTGNWTDPTTGLVYLRARDYDPATGQFLTVDPAFSHTHQPYAYVANDPVLETDPTGLCSLFGCISAAADGIGSALGSAAHTVDNATYDFLSHGAGAHAVSFIEGFGNAVTFGGVNKLDNAISPGASCTYNHDGYYLGGNITGDVTVGVLTDGIGEAFTADTAANAGSRLLTRLKAFDWADDTGAIRMGGRYNEDQNVLIQLAKQAKRTGRISMDDANALADWADELGLPGHGPAVHPGRGGFGGTTMHINIGPVKHIPVMP